MIFPSVFAHYIRGTQPRNMTLRDCNNNLWHLKMEKRGDDWHFTDGWRDFKKDNMIEKGDVLEYKYATESLLDFKILVLSGCEGGIELLKIKNIEGPNKRKKVKVDDEKLVDVRAEDLEADVDESASDEAESADNEAEEDEPAAADDESADDEAEDVEGADVLAAGTRVPMRIDYSGADVFASGRIRQPSNPYFVTQMRVTRINELYIPMDIIKGYNIQLPDKMMVVDSHGRRHPITRKNWKDGRTIYVGEWKIICKLNLARKGDKIICEFVRSDTGDLQLNVTFLPLDRRQG